MFRPATILKKAFIAISLVAALFFFGGNVFRPAGIEPEFPDSLIRRDEGSRDAPLVTAFVTAAVADDNADAEKVDPVEDPPKSRNTSADAMDTEDECPIDMMSPAPTSHPVTTKNATRADEEWLASMKHHQSLRLTHKRDVCASHYGTKGSSQTYIRMGAMFDFTYANDDHRFLISTVWKCGASHWREVVRLLHFNGSKAFRERQKDPYLTLNRVPDSQSKLRDYFKVMFVRHPFARLLSAYRDKVNGTEIPYYQNKAKKMIQFHRKGATKAEIESANATFLEFCTWLAYGAKGDNGDFHWYPLTKKYQMCQIPYDFIGKMETLADDVTYLFRLLKIDKLVSFPGGYNHTLSGDESLLHKYYRAIPDNIIKLLVKRYEGDFRIFGYRFPQNNSDFINTVDLKGV